jgi:hypothetical protein
MWRADDLVAALHANLEETEWVYLCGFLPSLKGGEMEASEDSSLNGGEMEASADALSIHTNLKAIHHTEIL